MPAPWGAHATLFRSTAVQDIVALPWHRGQVVEGWAALPLRLRLCVSPPVAFQETLPRESPLKGDFQRMSNAWHVTIHVVPCIAVLLGLVLLVVWVSGGNRPHTTTKVFGSVSNASP